MWSCNIEKSHIIFVHQNREKSITIHVLGRHKWKSCISFHKFSFFINSGQLYFTFYVCCCLICCPVIIWMHVMISVWAKMTILGAFLWMDSRMSKPPRNDQISLHFWDFVVVFIWSGLSKSACNILPATWQLFSVFWYWCSSYCSFQTSLTWQL